MYEGFDTARVPTILRTFMIINVLRRCDSVFIQWDAVKVSLCRFAFAKRPERPCISLICCIHIGVWRVLTLQGCHQFWGHLWSLMYCDAVTVSLPNQMLWMCHYAVLCWGHLWTLLNCDAVTVSLFNEMLWKCHYAVLCAQSALSVLALVLNCCIHIGVWRVLTLQGCHYSLEYIYDH